MRDGRGSEGYATAMRTRVGRLLAKHGLTPEDMASLTPAEVAAIPGLGKMCVALLLHDGWVQRDEWPA